jgi:hypothetical protein
VFSYNRKGKVWLSSSSSSLSFVFQIKFCTEFIYRLCFSFKKISRFLYKSFIESIEKTKSIVVFILQNRVHRARYRYSPNTNWLLWCLNASVRHMFARLGICIDMRKFFRFLYRKNTSFSPYALFLETNFCALNKVKDIKKKKNLVLSLNFFTLYNFLS